MKESSFSIQNTDLSKGIALCLLLSCHLFISYPNIGLAVCGVSVAHYFARISKVCVAIFVLMSGYGLNESIKRRRNWSTNFVIKRATRIYIDYWIVWIIFVPIGILFFDRTFDKVYGQDILLRALLNFLGLHRYFNIQGYNATWWYVSLTIGLYILFPIVNIFTKRFGLFFLAFTTPLLFIPFKFYYNINFFWFLLIYLPTFTLGIYLSEINFFVRLKAIASNQREIKLLFYLILLALIIWQRLTGIFKPSGIDSTSYIDGLFALLIVAVGYEYIFPVRLLGLSFVFIGKHSYNIFLFHTFIYYYYLSDFTYSFKYPVFIFLFLLISCLIVSVFIEKLKTISGINRLIHWITATKFRTAIKIYN